MDAYLMGHFDSNEYQMITQIRYAANQSAQDCGDYAKSKDNANAIAHQTGVYALYESDLAHNDDSIKASKSLDDMAQELKTKYNTTDKVSPLYCKLKFGGIEHSAALMQHVQGNRPR
jgi:hypothetical protein